MTRPGKPSEEQSAWVRERWDQMLNCLDAPFSLGTQHLPDEVVAQELAIYITGLTIPDQPRKGITSMGIRLVNGEEVRDNPKLTAAETEYVVSTLLDAAHKLALRQRQDA